MNIRITLIAIFCILIIGCSSQERDARLQRVAAHLEEDPHSAISALDSIDASTLSEADRFYDYLLTIKAQDKAYIDHTTDSLILNVIDYYASHKGSGLYAEALYYGGRVYSDLGDYPSALHYFQSALDLLPENTPNLSLRGNVLSQTGSLLCSLRLYNQAVPYTKGVIEIDRQLNDSINLVYDLQLLGYICSQMGNYNDSEKYLLEALAKSRHIGDSYIAKTKMHLAAVKYAIGQIDSALLLIRNVPALVKPASKNNALAYASLIYQASGIIDTAYIYAHELINSDYPDNIQTGYQTLLSPEIRPLIPPDTISKYISDYRRTFEHIYNENENQLAIIQQSLYNYQIHERERAKAEKSSKALQQWLFGICFIVLLMGIVILYQKNRNQKTIIKLRTAIENIEHLEQSLKLSNHENAPTNSFYVSDSKQTVHELREKLRAKLLALYNSDNNTNEVSHFILQSQAYHELQNQILAEKELKGDNPLWSELEAVILQCSPNFRANLRLLVGGKLTSYDLHTSILIKCGVTPTQMTTLFCRSKGTIVSRRESLCFRVFDEKLGTKVIDGVIRLL